MHNDMAMVSHQFWICLVADSKCILLINYVIQTFTKNMFIFLGLNWKISPRKASVRMLYLRWSMTGTL